MRFFAAFLALSLTACATQPVHLSCARSPVLAYPGTAMVVSSTIHGQPHHQA